MKKKKGLTPEIIAAHVKAHSDIAKYFKIKNWEVEKRTGIYLKNMKDTKDWQYCDVECWSIVAPNVQKANKLMVINRILKVLKTHKVHLYTSAHEGIISFHLSCEIDGYQSDVAYLCMDTGDCTNTIMEKISEIFSYSQWSFYDGCEEALEREIKSLNFTLKREKQRLKALEFLLQLRLSIKEVKKDV